MTIRPLPTLDCYDQGSKHRGKNGEQFYQELSVSYPDPPSSDQSPHPEIHGRRLKLSPKSRPRASQESAIYTLPLQVSCLLDGRKHVAHEAWDLCLGLEFRP